MRRTGGESLTAVSCRRRGIPILQAREIDMASAQRRHLPREACWRRCRGWTATCASGACRGISMRWLTGRVTRPAMKGSTCISRGRARRSDNELFRARQSDPSRITLVADHASQPCIGYLGLVSIDWSRRLIGNMGYRIHPSWCDRGIGTQFLTSRPGGVSSRASRSCGWTWRAPTAGRSAAMRRWALRRRGSSGREAEAQGAST